MIQVSIIIPTFNRGHYIERTIQSALEQDYPSLEIIVTDDASTDDTIQRLAKYPDQRVRIHSHAINVGMARNCRRAISEYAQGGAVLNLDSDDQLTDPGYITSAVDLLERHHLAFVFARQKVLMEKTGQIIEDRINRSLPKIMDGNHLFMNFLNNIYVPHLTCLYRRDLALERGLYQSSSISNDWEGFLKMSIGHRVGFIDRAVGIYRKHHNNLTRFSSPQTYIEQAAFIEAAYDFALRSGNFRGSSLLAWRRRLLKTHFLVLLLKQKLAGNDLRNSFRYIQHYDPQLHLAMRRDPRIPLLLTIVRMPLLAGLIFKYLLGTESLWSDLQTYSRELA